MSHAFTIIGLIAETTLKFINNTRCKVFWYRVFVTKETALLSFRQYNKNPKQNLSKEELAALTNLNKSKDIVIQKSGKGNSVVIVDRSTYIKRMENVLSDQRKLEKVTLKNDAFLNFVVNQGKRIDIILRN